MRGDGPRVRHNVPGTPYDAAAPGLLRSAQSNQGCEPIRLTVAQASLLPAQFRQTAAHRGWALLALAVMANHIHLVVGVPGDPDPAGLLRDFKSYAARSLNAAFGKPASGTWWTESGSRRKLPDDRAVAAAVQYVHDQAAPLVVWVAEDQGERGTSAP